MYPFWALYLTCRPRVKLLNIEDINMRIILTFGIAALLLTAHAYAGSHDIRLHITADPGAEEFIKNICITTNNGFTKSCGNDARLDRSSGNQNAQIVSYNLYTPFGFDDSCSDFYYGYKTPREKGTLEVFTTIHKDVVNHVRVVATTQCSSSFTQNTL